MTVAFINWHFFAQKGCDSSVRAIDSNLMLTYFNGMPSNTSLQWALTALTVWTETKTQDLLLFLFNTALESNRFFLQISGVKSRLPNQYPVDVNHCHQCIIALLHKLDLNRKSLDKTY